MNQGKLLRLVRVIVQLILLTVITWLALAAPTATVAVCNVEIERSLLIPMTMLSGLSVVGIWLVITLVFGRIYCSTMCPIGSFLDFSARIGALAKRPHHRPIYHYKPSQPWFVRTSMLAILFMSICFSSLGVSWSLLPFLQVSPYNTYIDMVDTVGGPMARILFDSECIPVSARIAMSAMMNLVFLFILGWLRGRDVCNTLCPVGAALGTVTTLSLFHFDIDTDRCTHCRRCEEACKASCVDSETGTVDASRCIACFDCVAACNDDAIHYTTRRHRLSTPMLMKVKNLEVKGA